MGGVFGFFLKRGMEEGNGVVGGKGKKRGRAETV